MILFKSCIDIGSNPTFTLENKSNTLLDSVILGASKKTPTVLLNVSKGEKKKGEILFNKEIVSDGSYFIEIYSKNKLFQSKGFGYYTNGTPLNSKFKLTVYKDSIAVLY